MTDELIERTRKTVFEKIGRNICNLQKIERLIKILVVWSTAIHGPESALTNEQKKVKKRWKKKTMGPANKEMFRTLFSSLEDIDTADELEKTWMSFKVTVESNAEKQAELRQALKKLIRERNNLVHHSLEKYDLNSIESCRRFADELDAQNERARPVFNELRGIVQFIENAGKEASESMESAEFQVQLQAAVDEWKDDHDGT